jgi:hypothetical protein
VLNRATTATDGFPEAHDPPPALAEAEGLSAALAEHEAHELPEARTQLEAALQQEATIPSIRADAAAGRLAAEQADARIRAIRTSLVLAQQRSEDAERLTVELRRRIADAGRAVVEAMLAEAREGSRAPRERRRKRRISWSRGAPSISSRWRATGRSTHWAGLSICKPEVTGSIPVRST